MSDFMYGLIFLLPPLGLCISAMFIARRSMHYFQLESYQFAGYFKTLKRQLKPVMLPCLAQGAVCAIAGLVYNILYNRTGIANGLLSTAGSFSNVLPLLLLSAGTGLLCSAAGWLLSKTICRRKEKKAFVLTRRMLRLYIVLFIITVAVTAVLIVCFNCKRAEYLLLSSLIFLILPLLVPLAAISALPIEKFINYLYLKDAEKKLLSHDHLIRIGITGSYGKTSVKFILAHILSQKYNVLATPASFNTPMGVTRVIRERLTPAHQVFIGEMGARHVGEIKELCGLVHPAIGVLTSVGPQHLDTFKSQERITKTKYELIESLPADGLAVFLNDDAIVTNLYQKTEKPKMLVGKENADAWAENVNVGPEGSSFILRLKGESPISCSTRLLGRHNIRNILLSCAVAHSLGLSMRQIQAGISSLEPVEHRMQIVSNAGGITVIDDAFNTNPRSSKEALDILKSFSGRRIIVTPGMVELGNDEASYNEEFGRAMASCVDIAVLVGKKHTEPIKNGLSGQGFDVSNIHTFDSLDTAVDFLQQIKQPGDVIMYENDLPDHYSEN